MLSTTTHAQIRKEEVDLPKQFNITKLTDYPPKLLITAQPGAVVNKSVTPQLRVQGLDRECYFPVIIGEKIQGGNSTGARFECLHINEAVA